MTIINNGTTGGCEDVAVFPNTFWRCTCLNITVVYVNVVKIRNIACTAYAEYKITIASVSMETKEQGIADTIAITNITRVAFFTVDFFTYT